MGEEQKIRIVEGLFAPLSDDEYTQARLMVAEGAAVHHICRALGDFRLLEQSLATQRPRSARHECGQDCATCGTPSAFCQLDRATPPLPPLTQWPEAPSFTPSRHLPRLEGRR